MEEFQYFGKHFVHEDLREKAQGKSVFTSDLKLPGMLCGRILRSPFAHARIRSVDKSRAMKVRGGRPWSWEKTILSVSESAKPGDPLKKQRDGRA